MGTVVADLTQTFVRIRDDRRTFIWSYRRYFFAHIGDLVRVCDHDLFCFFTAKIFKLFEHLFCCTQVKRCLFVGIGKSFARHNNAAVNFILRI